jgi:hypothetical protein
MGWSESCEMMMMVILFVYDCLSPPGCRIKTGISQAFSHDDSFLLRVPLRRISFLGTSGAGSGKQVCRQVMQSEHTRQPDDLCSPLWSSSKTGDGRKDDIVGRPKHNPPVGRPRFGRQAIESQWLPWPTWQMTWLGPGSSHGWVRKLSLRPTVS